VTHIAKNIEDIQQRLRQFEQSYGRATHSVKLLAVSKRHSVEKIRLAYAAGIRNFGENYVQEAIAKIEQLADLELTWHFIGPIQGNKTRSIAQQFQWVHSVDREKIARRLDQQRAGITDTKGRKSALNVCVQVNLSEESSKSGIDLEASQDLCEVIQSLPNLKLRGLMAIPAALSDFDEQRQCFHRLAAKFVSLAPRFPTMDTLSMGMSNDFEAAIAEGSTLIRIGTAIFGVRAAPS
jgi:hypothetical protein